MNSKYLFLVVLSAFWVQAAAGEDLLPAGNDEPYLRVEAGGPQNFITGLAFDRSGDVLYAAGWDKVVYVWRRDANSRQFVLQPDSTYRLPIGPEVMGAINAMATSMDGQWLAVGGHGMFRGTAQFRQTGRVFPSEGVLTPEMRRDEGLIYVFNTVDRTTRVLRGHAGSVTALGFAPGLADSPVLVSAGREWREKADGTGRFVGTVRVWDVADEKASPSSIAVLDLDLPIRLQRPSLAVRRLGPAPPQIEVAIAWGDQKHRLWDVAKDRLQASAVGESNNTIAYCESTGGFLSGAYTTNTVRTSGTLDHRQALQSTAGISLDIEAREAYLVPRAIGVFPVQPKQDEAVVVSRILGDTFPETYRNKYILQTVRLAGGKFGPLSGRTLLWNASASETAPCIAVSKQGLVAVAGDVDHSIWLYDAKGLSGNARPIQILRNAGNAWERVAFVTKQDRRGLLLTAGSTQLVFDLIERQATVQAEGWKSDSSTASDWQMIVRKEGDQSRVVVQRANRDMSQPMLPESEVVSAHAFLPASKQAGRPAFVAIASHRRGQVTLRLYNAETGEPFRQLTGHSQTITGLSFDANAELLASVAGDQTVCLWDLTDWDAILGRHGTPSGVAVSTKDQPSSNQLMIARIRDSAPASIRNSLAQGDVVKQLQIKDESRTWTSVMEFYDAFWSLPPGSTAILRINRQGKDRDVPVRVGQGIDERKPLFSLFISAPDQRQARDWIGWSPIGPYEASGRDAERFLGWHFNTGEATNPTRFAAADEYRKTYYRDALIKELVENRRFVQRQAPRPAAIGLRFGDESRQERGPADSIVLRQPPRTIHVIVGDFPANFVDAVEIEAEQQRLEQFSALQDNEWVKELESATWSRGTRHFRATVRTNETPPREFTHAMNVAFVPLPPEINCSLPARQQIKEATFRFEADVRSLCQDAVVVKLKQNGRELDSITREKSVQVDRMLTLEPGDNVLEITCANEGATAETRDAETVHREFIITYHKAKALPPSIAFLEFESLDPASGKWSEVWKEASQTSLVVQQPQLRVRGAIRAGGKPTSAQWTRGNDGEGRAGRKPLTLENSNSAEIWHFAQPLTLEPGEQQIGFFAQLEDSDEASQPLRVDFRPALPVVEWEFAGKETLVEKDAHESLAAVDIVGKLQLPEPIHPFDVQVIVNDESIGAPTIDLEQRTFTKQVPLRARENRVRIVTTNQWKSESTSDTRIVEYRRLPRITAATNTPVQRTPFTDVTVEIESPTDRPLTQVTINDRQLDVKDFQKTQRNAEVTVWQVAAKAVSLVPGKNVIQIAAANSDGPARKNATVEVLYSADDWKAATIDFPQGSAPETVSNPVYELVFQIQSPSPVKDIRVEHNQQPLTGGAITSQRRPSTPASAGGGQWSSTASLSLVEGINRIVVMVQNAGGEARAVREISYVPPPIRIQVASIEPEGMSPAAIVPKFNSSGRLVFPKPLATGRARLKGTVHWTRKSNDKRKAAPELRVWVNGFQQLPFPLKAEQLSQPFDSRIVLSEEKQNVIMLDIAGRLEDAQSRLTFHVDCLKPQRAQRLHLLVIGANQRDAGAIKRRALQAVRVKLDANGNIMTPLQGAGFERIHAYEPLVGTITFSNVFRLLLDVKANLKIPLAPDPSGNVTAINDVVMMYYEGGLLVPRKDRFVLCTSERFDPEDRFSGVSSDWLAEFFDPMRGAQLAFIDVRTDKPPTEVPIAGWTHNSHAALLCYAWQRGFFAPEDRRLISAFGTSLATSTRLGEVDAELARMSTAFPEVDYSRVLPEHLKKLTLMRN